MKNIVVMGAGGFGAEAIWVLEDMNKYCDAAEQWNILGYVDDDASKKDKEFYDYRTLGTPSAVAEIYRGQEVWYFCAIGSNSTREGVAKRLDGLGWRPAILIHPSVIMARNTSIGEGTYIGAGSIVCPNAAIGRHIIINVRVAIGHDAVLEDFSQAGPGAQINGFCRLGLGAMVGSNASILPGKSIGMHATVGGNSQVVCTVRPNTTVNGVPAVVINK